MMDLASLIGPIIAIGMIYAGIVAKKATYLLPEIAVNPASVFIVIGGTLGKLLVAYTLSDFVNAFKSIGIWVRNPQADRDQILYQILDLANLARKELILAL